ncbi:hypothetical protein PF010_g13564 [Phytophthora fragariae]|uniref:Uncharacterized protein n=1 Tax=Phytophthora fragariae TaxID=53985 RepID=A0A6G0L0B7_9STRA|nr:hypothetical protein PF010_g13564 [Phytophthora fragariae]
MILAKRRRYAAVVFISWSRSAHHTRIATNTGCLRSATAVAVPVPLASSARCTTRGAVLASPMTGGPCGPAISTNGAAFRGEGRLRCARQLFGQ